MKTKILTTELLSSRNKLVKKYLSLQAKSIYELGSGDAIIKRIDDLMDLQEAIKQLDILIGYAKKKSYSWDFLSLMVLSENIEEWKPEIAKLSDWKDLTKKTGKE
jgi:hypothetical protein